MDYFARLFLQGSNLSMYLMENLPIAILTNETANSFSFQNSRNNIANLEHILKSTALKLVCLSSQFNSLLQEVFGPQANYKTHGVTDPVQRQILKNQIDAMVAKIYGLEEAELKHILSTFPLVEEEIKEGVLEEWRKLM
ncbi:hypothetical protein [Leptospira santarosai]